MLELMPQLHKLGIGLMFQTDSVQIDRKAYRKLVYVRGGQREERKFRIFSIIEVVTAWVMVESGKMQMVPAHLPCRSIYDANILVADKRWPFEGLRQCNIEQFRLTIERVPVTGILRIEVKSP